MTPYLAEVFGPGGYLARAFPGYEPRDGQIAMAEAVNAAIREGRPLLAEAGTGVGKSIGYLVPVIWHLTEGAEALVAGRLGARSDADEEEEGDQPPPRALIVTANHALQEQIFHRDIPTLARVLPWNCRAAIAKGKGNFLCCDRLDESGLELGGGTLTLTDDEREQWRHIRPWAAETKTGDFAELPFEIAKPLRSRLAIAADDCLGQSCPFVKFCHAERARARVEAAQIIVTNYHLLFAHYAMEAEFGRGLLPRFDIVIMDEAHLASDVSRDFFGYRVTPSRVKAAARFLVPSKRRSSRKMRLPPLGPALHQEVIGLSDKFFRELDHLRATSDGRQRLDVTRTPAWEPLASGLGAVADTYDAAIRSFDLGLDAPRIAELERAARKARLLEDYIRRAMTGDDRNEVPFLDVEDGHAVLAGRLIHVGHVLRDILFESRALRTVVATSATLTTGPGEDGWAFPRRELGAKCARTLVAASPFDYARQALVVVPAGLPDPRREDFAEAVAERMVEAIRFAGGRTLGLFTSRKNLRLAAERIRASLGGRFEVLVQGEAPRTQLVRRFREDRTSVLLGTRSFWAGVDVPGDACSCVVIDRIPFDAPNDPIVDALSARDPRAFENYCVPRATIELRQGFGRLIRTTSDRGVVVLLDRRLVDKGYGRRMLKALPGAPLSRRLEDIALMLPPVEVPEHLVGVA